MSGINSNTVLLLHGDGADNGTAITDRAKGYVPTVYGNAKTASAIRWEGQAAIVLDGLGDGFGYLDSADFRWNNESVTLDFRIRFAQVPALWSVGYQRPYTKFLNASNRVLVDIQSNTIGLFATSGGVTNLRLTGACGSLSTGQWYHIALVLTSTSAELYLSGTKIDQSTHTGFPNISGASVAIGYHEGTYGFVNGYIEELRIVKGVAMWTEDFTPPTEPYSPDIPVATIQVTQEQATRIEKTYTVATETAIITEIPYDASEHPAEINLSATAMAGTKSLYTVVNPAYIEFTGYAYASQPVIGNADLTLKALTDDFEPYIPTVSDSVFPIPGIVGHRVLEQDLPTLSIAASASISATWNLNANLARIEAVITGNQEVRANLSRTLRPLTLSAESEYTNVVGSLNGTLNPIIFATQARGSFGLNWTFNITLPKITLSATAIHDVHASLSQELEAIALEGEIDSLVFEIIAMNLLNKAITNFTNYPFNSLCCFNGNYYGCSRDGIYKLAGVDDFGTDISAYVETGLLDLEVRLLSRIRHAYLGFKSSGLLTLTITTDDGESYSYQTEQITTNYQGQKVKFGKGFKDRYIKLKIANTDGCTFSIDKTRVFDEPVQHRKR